MQNFIINTIQSRFYNEFRKNFQSKRKFCILKARQFGMSTFVEAMLFHDILFNKDKRALVMAHSQAATEHIFDMTKKFYNNLHAIFHEDFLFPLAKSNAKELLIKTTGSLFKATTTGGKGIGRSTTYNYIHASEVAFWANPKETMDGVYQVIDLSLDKSNYIIFESTANGNNYFKELYERGLDPKSDIMSLFYGWNMYYEYRRPFISKEEEEEFRLTEEEINLQKTYNLSKEQLNWRRNKISSEFFKRESYFKQEYPLCWQEAFLASSQQYPLIPIDYIQKAAKNPTIMNTSRLPIVVGIDTARTNDRTCICLRQGRKILTIFNLKNRKAYEIKNFLIYEVIEKYAPAKIFIDYAYGVDIADDLNEQGYHNIEAIHFNTVANVNTERYTNIRAQMYDKMREWFIKEDIKIPDVPELINELSIIPDMKMNSSGKLFMKKKEDIKELNNNMSPDFADSIALTFAKPVSSDNLRQGTIKIIKNNNHPKPIYSNF
ncbi:MAG: hypothetical protein LBH46_04385 [Rickettsiales bacterium]|nr:hypothetical protein [Rickettsiales bacterium]